MWALAYWRPLPEGQVAPDGKLDGFVDFVPLVGLTVLTVLFGLFPEHLMALLQEAAASLLDPTAYIQSVFPNGGGQ